MQQHQELDNFVDFTTMESFVNTMVLEVPEILERRVTDRQDMPWPELIQNYPKTCSLKNI
jgi:hypothetical protein